MTDRDIFAAAALTGLLTKDDAAKPESMAPWWPEWACAAAYRWADAMLRERERTNHDAWPEAKATNDGGTPKEAAGTGNTTVQFTHGDDITVRLTRWCEQPADRAETQGLMDQAAREIERLRLTDKEQEAIQRVVEYSSLREKELSALQLLLRRLA
jgi:hypothetical protein